MKKRTSLVAALHDAGGKPAQTSAPAVLGAAAVPVVEASTAARPPSRAGLRAVTTYVSPEAHGQLAMLAIELGQKERRKVSAQELMTEALNDFFRKHGRAPIA